MKKLFTFFFVFALGLISTNLLRAQCTADVAWVDVAGPSISASPIAYCGDELGITGVDTLLIPFAVINTAIGGVPTTEMYNISSDLGVSLVSPLEDGFFTYLAVTQDDLDAAGTSFYIAFEGTNDVSYSFELTANVADLGIDDILLVCDPPPVECADGEIAYTFIIDAASSSYPNEMSWEVVDANGTVLASAACGETGNESVDLCLTVGEIYTFNAYDDWGDGWNGGSYSIETGGAIIYSNSTVNNGTAGDDSDACDGDDLESSYSFEAGGAIAGCTDPDAFNYNPAATEDDGSCVYDCAGDILWVDASGPILSDFPIALCGADAGLTGEDTILIAYAILNSDFEVSYDITASAGISLSTPLDDGFFTYIALSSDDVNNNTEIIITATGTSITDCSLTNTINIADLDQGTLNACLGVTPSDCADGEIEYIFTIDGASSSYPNEMSWEVVDANGNVLANASCGNITDVAIISLCLTEGETYTFNAYDDWGDGWNGGSYSIETGGVVIYSNTTVNNGTAGDDSDACDGDDLESSYSFEAGGAIAGCTDPDAFNYNPAATEDDGSCVYDCAGDILWVDASGPALSDFPIALCGVDAGLTGADTIVIAFAILNSDFEINYDITSTAGLSLSTPLEDGFFTYLALSSADIANNTDITITATGTSFADCSFTNTFSITDLDDTVLNNCIGGVDPCENTNLTVSASVDCDVDGNGDNTGTATLNITTSGGLGNVTVDTNSETLNNGDSYSYTITATDEAGCTATTTVSGTVNCPTVDCSTSDLAVAATVDCNFNSDGGYTGTATLNITTSGGQGNVTVDTNSETLNDGDTYSYTIIATDEVGCTASTTINGVVNCPESPVSIVTIDNQLGLMVKPIPASNNVTLTINTTDAANAQISIIDLSGRTINRLNNELGLGTNNIDINIENLVSGVYFINVNANNVVNSIKFVKQ